MRGGKWIHASNADTQNQPAEAEDRIHGAAGAPGQQCTPQGTSYLNCIRNNHGSSASDEVTKKAELVLSRLELEV